ncbi:peptidylprolyl isomerase [Parahaliea sp. F7430]|uniref:peptidylprolyl isomerase n=1 Tax=Sediminihaliea albiluteola TaxID=2758564 RepID=A0A7W2YKN6_9GAMM|nr:peptidylprolyl isomerase [Sediminihaliea albiluteola]MBA6414277.1 peptidylprolyl isomerase [Sediminihaliea albiluteola]
MSDIKQQFFLLFFVVALTFSGNGLASIEVVRDQGTAITAAELDYLVSKWTRQMRDSAQRDKGDRLELLNMSLSNKKLSKEADKINPEKDGELYWDYMVRLQTLKRNFVLEKFVAQLNIPEMDQLAKERYTTQKEKYAKIPETRISSHILFSSPPGLPRDGVLSKAAEVLDQLRSGASFEELVVEYSEDPGSKNKGGKFDRWVSLGQPGVSPPYTGGLFEIKEIGGYSDLVQTEFGVHIIRLDGIKEEGFKPFEDVREGIIAELENEYKKLAIKDYISTFQITDEAYINEPELEKILNKYPGLD